MVRGALFKLIPFVPRQRCGVAALPASIDLPWSTRATTPDDSRTIWMARVPVAPLVRSKRSLARSREGR